MPMIAASTGDEFPPATTRAELPWLTTTSSPAPAPTRSTARNGAPFTMPLPSAGLTTQEQRVLSVVMVAGSPATVREKMEHMIKDLRLGSLFLLFQIGNMPDDKVRNSTKLFADNVMPQLRDIWPEWKNDDRFWVKPLESRVRPELPRNGR